MKMSQLKMAIREVVREEIRLGLKEIVGEINQPIKESKSSQPKPKKKIVEKKQYTKNSILNEVMNETAASEEWKTMGGGTYDSSRASEVLSSTYGKMMSDRPSGNLAVSMGVNPNDAPDFLTKDYRKLMKTIDKKKGISNG